MSGLVQSNCSYSKCLSLIVFTVIVTIFFKGEHFAWNHIVAFLCLVAAVYFVFKP